MKPIDWDIRREGRLWSHEEFDQRIYQAPEKIEYVDGIFASDRERLIVLGMLLENLGIDRVVQFGRLEDLEGGDRRPGEEAGYQEAALIRAIVAVVKGRNNCEYRSRPCQDRTGDGRWLRNRQSHSDPARQ